MEIVAESILPLCVLAILDLFSILTLLVLAQLQASTGGCPHIFHPAIPELVIITFRGAGVMLYVFRHLLLTHVANTLYCHCRPPPLTSFLPSRARLTPKS